MSRPSTIGNIFMYWMENIPDTNLPSKTLCTQKQPSKTHCARTKVMCYCALLCWRMRILQEPEEMIFWISSSVIPPSTAAEYHQFHPKFQVHHRPKHHSLLRETWFNKIDITRLRMSGKTIIPMVLLPLTGHCQYVGCKRKIPKSCYWP